MRRPVPAEDGPKETSAAGTGADEGSAVVEFVFLAVLLVLPLVYVLLAVFAVQRAAHAVTTAAREAGRAYVTSATDGDGKARARRAAEVVLADHGLRIGDAIPTFTCDRRPCLRPDGRVTVRLATRVPLPFLGGIPGAAPWIGVDAEHVEVVDRFRELG